VSERGRRGHRLGLFRHRLSSPAGLTWTSR
jgi:hypothetical protein